MNNFKPNYINSVNYFRAVAVLFIVSSHCYDTSNVHLDSILGNTFYNLNKGGTYFFIFISGLLFHHVYSDNFKYFTFILKKIKNILLPYIVISTLPILYFVLFDNQSLNENNKFLQPNGDGFLQFYLIPMLKYYLTGFRLIANWYIPFIMTVFVLSPLFLWIIRSNFKLQVFIFIVLITISIFIHKPLSNSTYAFLQSVLYYSPIYLLGIMYSEKKEYIQRSLLNKEYILLIIFISIAFLQSITGKQGNFYKNAFDYGGIDLMIIQKMFFSIFLITLLNRYESSNFKILKLLSKCSFGIFFTHGLFILSIEIFRKNIGFEFASNNLFTLLFVSLFILCLSLISTLIIKKITPKYSRYIIGS